MQPGGVWKNDASADVYELGAKLVMLGVIGIYIGQIYRNVQGRPVYIVGERVGAVDNSLREVKPVPAHSQVVP